MGSYLYASPSFLAGAARLLDFGNTYDAYNHTVTGSQADSLGLLWDWAVVGNDLWQGEIAYQADKVEQSRRNGIFKIDAPFDNALDTIPNFKREERQKKPRTH